MAVAFKLKYASELLGGFVKTAYWVHLSLIEEVLDGGRDFACPTSYDKPRQCIKKQRYHFADKGPYSQNYDFSSSHVQMGELDHKEGGVPKNWSFQTVMLEKTLESHLNCKIKSVNAKGNQPWILIGRTDAEAPILSPTRCKKLTHWKRPWCWERLRAGGEGSDTGWDGWMGSMTQWTRISANSKR